MAERVALVCGMPRSGTTWIGKIIDSHPLTDYRHEPDNRRSMPDIPLLPEAHDRWQGPLNRFIDSLADQTDVRVCGKLPLFPKAWGGGPKATLLKLNILASKLAARAGSSLPVRRTLLSPRGRGLLLWKSVESVGRLGLIAAARPDIPIVFVIRHPCGHVASVLRGEVGARFDASADLRSDRRLLDLLAQSPAGRAADPTFGRLARSTREAALAWRWRVFNDHALSSVAGSGNVLVVKYDDVCHDPRGQFARIFKHIGLDWTKRNEAFLAQSTSRSSSRYYAVQKRPMQSAQRWMQELSEEQQAQVASVVSGSAAGALFDYRGPVCDPLVAGPGSDRSDLRTPSPIGSTALHPQLQHYENVHQLAEVTRVLRHISSE